MKPKSPLPWKRQLLPEGQYEFQDANNEQVFEDGTFPDLDARYVLHACNSYPKLLAFVKHMEKQIGYEWLARGTLRDIGERE